MFDDRRDRQIIYGKLWLHRKLGVRSSGILNGKSLLYAGIPIENPLLKDFQTNYEKIYRACENGCASSGILNGKSLLYPIYGVGNIRQQMQIAIV